MFLNKHSLISQVLGILTLVSCFAFFPTPANSQSIILEVKIGDTALVGTQTEVRIPVYLTNLTDSVGAFDFSIINDRPDLVSLRDTIISEGCLTENWEMLNSQFKSDTPIYGVYLRLLGIADWISEPEDGAAVYFPQTGEIPLFYLLADIIQESDSTNARAILSFIVDDPTDFMVSDEMGYTVGTRLVELIDTVYYACAQWYSGECLSWVEVPGPPADSIEYWVYHQAWIDSSVTNILSGQIDVGWHLCGDIAGSDDKVNLLDITAMIALVYMDGTPPDIPWAANVNGSLDGKVNLADITRLISHIYLSGGPLECYAP